MQQSRPDPSKDVVLDIHLRGIDRGSLSAGLDGDASVLHLQDRNYRPAWKLQASRDGCADNPDRSNGNSANLQLRRASASGQLPVQGSLAGCHEWGLQPTVQHPPCSGGDVPHWHDGYAAGLQAGGTGCLSDRSGRHTAKLPTGTACNVSCGPGRHTAKLPTGTACDVSCGPDRYAAELPTGTACDVSCGPGRYAAKLPGGSAGAMSRGHGGHAAPLHAGAEADHRPAATACTEADRRAAGTGMSGAKETQCRRAVRLRQDETASGAAFAAPALQNPP